MSIAGYFGNTTRQTRLQVESFRGIGPVLEGRLTLEQRLKELSEMTSHRADTPNPNANLKPQRGPTRFPK